MKKLLEEITSKYRSWLVDVRRDLHQHPELAFEEVRTAQIMADNLKAFGLDVKKDLGRTGVVGLLTNDGKAPTVAIRGDMDALPIQEENDVPYASLNPGVMHACGHDAHTTIILGVARFLAENPDFLGDHSGQVKFIFQPAEEGRAGAAAMIRDGVLSDPPVDVIFGAHMVHTLPVGTVGLTPGPALAAFDRIEIKVTGKGGHAARPESTVDPVVTSSYLVTALQSIVSRNVNPLESAVLSIGSITAGNAFNVIPGSAVLVGTLRTLSNEVRELARKRIRDMAEQVAGAFGAKAEVDIEEGYPVMLNDPDCTAFARQTLETQFGKDPIRDIPPVMASEDFSYYLQQVPGTFFRLGCGNVDRGITHSIHSPRFDIDEDVLPFGVAVFSELIRSYLKQATSK